MAQLYQLRGRVGRSNRLAYAFLTVNPGKVLTYDFISKAIWGPETRSNNQLLRVNMANIRRKLEQNPAEPHYIFTEVGVGYRMLEKE